MKNQTYCEVKKICLNYTSVLKEAGKKAVAAADTPKRKKEVARDVAALADRRSAFQI